MKSMHFCTQNGRIYLNENEISLKLEKKILFQKEKKNSISNARNVFSMIDEIRIWRARMKKKILPTMRHMDGGLYRNLNKCVRMNL